MIKPIAIYLPQFHPVPENDEWWGKGFTEWTNVTKAKPWYKGHYQPHLPTDMGFYDLRLPETQQAQADLAREYGIYGFCYYHYWFNGRRILERPFQQVFESGSPDFPFMLCWANENWTRRWDGFDSEVLLKQSYSFEDDLEHIRYLLPIFKDNRYIKIKGKPVFAFYKSNIFPDIKETIKIWRREAAKEGIELYLCRFENFGNTGESYLEDGFDSGIDFQPFGNYMDAYRKIAQQEYMNNYPARATGKIKRTYYNIRGKKDQLLRHRNLDNAVDYNKYVDHILHTPITSGRCFPSVTPSWDNSARKKDGVFMFRNANPDTYKKWLAYVAENIKKYNSDENFIFINAWNEWAEGNHLEPCIKWGRKYLEATKEAIEPFNRNENE